MVFKLKKTTAIFVLVIFLLLTSGFLIGYLYRTRPRIAYVRTMELVYGYNGMRDAHAEYKKQTDEWQSNVDTLRIQYQHCLSDYQTSYKTLSEKERADKETLIKKLEDNLRNYTSVVKQQAQEKEKAMTQSVLNQINSMVNDYAKRKGYDLVLGGNDGSILYGDKAYDITDDVLLEINKNYKIVPQEQSKLKQ